MTGPLQYQRHLTAEEALHQRWAQRNASATYCPDGAVDWSTYSAERGVPRVAAVLREPNGTDPVSGEVEGFDIRQYLRERPLGLTYTSVARWVWAAQNRFPPLDAVKAVAGPTLRRALMGSAVINLKKWAGTANSDLGTVAAIAARDSDLLHEQLELLDPDIVFAGGTWEHTMGLLGVTVTPPGQFPQVALVGRRLVIGFHHPSARGRRQWQPQYTRLPEHAEFHTWYERARPIPPARP